MPQTFQVLRCYKCFIFQIHQTKKNSRWICKICSEKQSIKRHYGIGTGKECRLHVQKLNKLQSEKYSDSDISDSDKSYSDSEVSTQDIVPTQRKRSKWSIYTKENDVIEEPISVNCRDKDWGFQRNCENMVVDDLEFSGDAMIQNTQTFENKTKSTVVEQPHTRKLHCFNKMNRPSKCPNFTNIENNSQQYMPFRNNENNGTEKIFNKVLVNSSSKWDSYLDDSNDTETQLNHCNSTNFTCITSKREYNVPSEDNKTKDHHTNENLVTNKQTEMQGIPFVQCKQSFFSISDDQDLDVILDVNF